MAGPRLQNATLDEMSLLLTGGSRRPDGRANRGRASANPAVPPPPPPPTGSTYISRAGDTYVTRGGGNTYVSR